MGCLMSDWSESRGQWRKNVDISRRRGAKVEQRWWDGLDFEDARKGKLRPQETKLSRCGVGRVDRGRGDVHD